MLKFMYVKSLETASELSADIKLPANIIGELLEQAKEAALVSVLGAAGFSMTSELRYELTNQGRERAQDALSRSQYLGPAPVPLADYIARITRQRVADERIDRDELKRHASHLVLPPGLLDELGPAANSGRAMLLYGPPGSGKTSIAEVVGETFKGMIYVPYAVEIDGQIITLYDPTLHEKVGGQPQGMGGSLLMEATDARWVPCKRPVVLAGGELSLDMLDLRYSPEAGVYEAPLQVKAMNGIFVMDDFGRQLVQPRDLLNRWIVPLEKRFDFLHLNTGKKFLLPFDVLVVFSTNLAPEDLMDDAFLRRIPYKIHVGVPTVEDYAEIFRRVCADSDLRIPSGMMDELVRDFYGKQKEPLASYHPKFLIDRVIDSCRYAGTPPYLDTQRLRGAWRNLFVEKGKHKSI
jgi:predicted ATPase with chaperone activity